MGRLPDHESDNDPGGRREGSRYRYVNPNEDEGDQPPSNDPVEIDVLVAYSPAALDVLNKSPDEVEELVKEDIRFGTQASVNSKTTPRFRLVKIMEMNLAEARSLSGNIDRAQDPDDGVIDEVVKERNKVGADVVVLLVDIPVKACGRSDDIYAAKKTAFVAVEAECAGGKKRSISHELGHALGGRHNIEEDRSVTPFREGHGYLNERAKFGTIMAYPCDDCRRAQFRSSADQNIRHRGSPIGNDTADNASVFRRTAKEVAAFCAPREGGCDQPR